MKLYDTSLEKLYEFNQDEIKIYVCGPTVYNDVHIGNIRPPIIFDVLHRYFLFKGVKVNYISNITDIDDKIVNAAIDRNQNELDFSHFYYLEYLKILNDLNIKLPNKMPKVSDNMEEMKNFIDQLIQRQIGYVASDGIYFDTSKVNDYGIISHMKVDQNFNQSFEEKIADKKNVSDFALWKYSQKGLTWEFKHGNGRPGWHTECVVLINKYLGNEIDIHGGGIDLRFPHHENENAQTMACYHHGFSKVWMHIGHVMINDDKMSKSLNNFIIAKDLLSQYSSNAVRWMFYQVNYTKPFNYCQQSIIDATNSIDKIEVELNRVKTYLIMNDIVIEQSTTLTNEIMAMFENNLNLSDVVTYIFNVIKTFANLIRMKNWIELKQKYEEIILVLSILGIEFKNNFNQNNLAKIQKWKMSLKNKDYESADQLRRELMLEKLL